MFIANAKGTKDVPHLLIVNKSSSSSSTVAEQPLPSSPRSATYPYWSRIVLATDAGPRAPSGGVTRQGVVHTDLQSPVDCK